LKNDTDDYDDEAFYFTDNKSWRFFIEKIDDDDYAFMKMSRYKRMKESNLEEKELDSIKW